MKIDHIGIAVAKLDAVVPIYEQLGMELELVEEVVSQGVRVAMFPAGESRVELLEPLNEESPIAKFLARRGSGVHHIAFRVSDLAAELERLKARGVRLVDEEPRKGAHGALIAFLHPASTGGVLVELCQQEAS